MTIITVIVPTYKLNYSLLSIITFIIQTGLFREDVLPYNSFLK